jgi:O-antigen/teichoic acid export membrane protein
VTVAGFSVLLVVVLGLGIFGVILGQLVGTIVATTLGLWLSRHFYGPAFDMAALRDMLRFSVPLVPSGIGVLVTLYVDRAAIRALMTLADVGLFGIGYRIASIAGLVMIGFQVALTPLIYAHYRDEGMPGQLARIFRTFVGFAVLMILVLALFAREIVAIISTPAYHGAAVVVPMLAPALLLSAMYIFAPGLAIARRTGPIAGIHITTAVVNTALNLTLIPVLGIVGAALATLCSAVLAFAAYMVLSQRHYPVPHDWARLAAAAVLGGACLGAGLMLDPVSAWSAIGRVALVVLATAALIWLGVIRLSELRALTRFPFSASRTAPEIQPE